MNVMKYVGMNENKTFHGKVKMYQVDFQGFELMFGHEQDFSPS